MLREMQIFLKKQNDHLPGGIKIPAWTGTAFFAHIIPIFHNDLSSFIPEREGILQSINALPIAQIFGVPPETIVPLTIYVASPKAGITLLGPMISNGSISEVKALIVLMLGSMFMLPFYSIRSLMPNYTSVFGMRLGLSLVVISTGISVLVRLLVLIVLMVQLAG